MRGTTRAAIVVLAAVILVPRSALSDAFHASYGDLAMLRGVCDPASHISEGRPEEDLTQHQRPLACNAAALTSFKNVAGHMLIQFGSTNKDGPIVGFAGMMQDNSFLELSGLYLPSGHVSTREGGCKLFWKGREPTDILCVGVVETPNHKTVYNVHFKPTPRASAKSGASHAPR